MAVKQEQIEYVPYRLIENACKKQERKNIEKVGRSLSWVSMLHHVNPFVIAYQCDNKISEMRPGWRDAIKLLH